MTLKIYNNLKQNGERMMRRISPCFLLMVVFAPALLAGYSDGFITTGEYEYGVEWFSGSLVVNGGGQTKSGQGITVSLRCNPLQYL
jgi:hypothetical protein